ncbi:phosphate propanoyltransferase [Sporosarcina sp. CAU 1771]
MDPQWIQSIVEEVLQQVNKKGSTLKPSEVPIAVSARHVHLSEHDLAVLFGPSHGLTKLKELSQPNQFAAEETVTVAGPKGSISRVRVLGPARNLTQVEVSQTDAFALGLKPPLRQSGNIEGSSPVTIIGPKGSLYLEEGLIIAQSHIHMSPSDAEGFGVSNGQYVQVKAETERPMTFDRVLVRVSSSYRLEMHIDTDEANAGFIRTGQAGRLIVEGQPATTHVSQPVAATPQVSSSTFEGKLLTQLDVENSTGSIIRVRKSTIVTPLAKDRSRDLNKKIETIDG